MKTYTNRFNKAIKQLNKDIDFTNSEYEDLDVVEILEPTCNLNFVNRLIGITKEGMIVTQQYSYDLESKMINNFRDVMSKYDKENLCHIVESQI